MQTLGERLLAVMTRPRRPERERALAGRVLTKLGDPRPEVMTVAAMPFCAIPPSDFYRTESNERASLPYPYWMGRWPVSNAQFAEFIQADGYHIARYWPEAKAAGDWKKGAVKEWRNGLWRSQPCDYSEPFTLPNHPVVGISWYEAAAFCRWLSEKAEPQGWQVRLPTQAEWEKAARGGLELPRQDRTVTFGAQQWEVVDWDGMQENELPQRRYPWGETLAAEGVHAQANFDATQIGATSALGCFTTGASPYGVEELSGNVWEWGKDVDSRGWVWQCGGAYWNDADEVTSEAAADHYVSREGYFSYGFRCVVFPLSRG